MLYSHAYIKSQAEELVKKFGIESPPVNLKIIAQGLDLEIIELSLPLWLFGTLLRDKGHYYIVLNKIMSQEKKKFTIAHEIAHYLLHPNHISYMHNSRRPWKHWQADVYAAELCLPSFLVKEEARKWFNDYKFLAKTFEVTEEMMIKKFEELKIFK